MTPVDHSGHMHSHEHAFAGLNPPEREGLVVASRRNMLKAGLAGMAGLSLPGLLRGRAAASEAGRPIAGQQGRHPALDGRRPEPDRHLGPQARPAAPEPRPVRRHPDQAARRLVLRAPAEAGGDARQVHDHPLGRLPAQQPRAEQGLSDGQPRGRAADQSRRPRCTRRSARSSPSTTGRISPAMPPYVAFLTSRSHVAFAGYLGKRYDPFIANRAARLPIYTNVGVDTGRTTGADFFQLPAGLTHERLQDRRALLADLDRLRGEIDRSRPIEAMDQLRASRRSSCSSAAGPATRSTCRRSRERGPRALRQAPLVPAGAAGPAAGRGGRRRSSRST